MFRTRENPITCRGLTFKQRVSYFASLFNYFSGLQRFALLGVLVLTLATGALPFHASPLALVALWLPWSVLAFVATLQLGRGSLGTMDSSRYGLLTMGINIRGIIAIVRRSTPRRAAAPLSPRPSTIRRRRARSASDSGERGAARDISR